MQENILTFPHLPPNKEAHLPKHHFPLPLTSLVGREHEVAEVCALLQRPEVRLLTLAGTGGVGKTRMALQVATDLPDDVADEVYFVSLAFLSDFTLVMPLIAQLFGLIEKADQSALAQLKVYLQDKHLLLVLDNFEQVVVAAPLLVDLLQTCPYLKALVTSRILLHVRGEYEFFVPSLAVPMLTSLPDSKAVLRYEAVALFVQRVQGIRADFTMTDANASVIAEICTRLDGLPLAIELAAARLRLLSLHQLLERLDHRLEVLTSGAHDLPERQQTLQKTLQWSYDLLSENEQRLFRHLSIFIGGCTIEAVEAICSACGSETTHLLDEVMSLLENNLLYLKEQSDGEQRLMMLETIREYGLVCLENSGETEVVRRAHAAYYAALAEEVEPKLISAEQSHWLRRLEQEHNNLRATLNWSLERGEIEMALRLGGALWLFWLLHAHSSEGHQWLEKALAHHSECAASVRAKALYAAASHAYYAGNNSRAAVLGEECLDLYRKLGDQRGIAIMLNGLGHIALSNGDYDRAQALGEESLPLLKALGDHWYMAESLYLIAYGFSGQGNYATARALGKESLALCKEIGDRRGIADVLHALGLFSYRQNDYDAAHAFYQESLAVSEEAGEKWVATLCLVGLGEVAAAEGQAVWAAQLWGAAETFLTLTGTFIPPAERATYEYSVVATRTELGERAFASAWAQGRTMTLGQTLGAQEPGLRLIHSPSAPLSMTITSPSTALPELTSRERNVLRLLATGLTSRQIAEQLIISVLTVNSHIRTIYRKLDITSRSAATRYALEHRLV